MDNQRFAFELGRFQMSNIGDDAGTLILFTSPTLTGSWINLTPSNRNDSQVRGEVCECNLPQGVSFAAVYPYLRPGIYSIQGSEQKVTISSGLVTTLDYFQDCCRIYHHPSTMSVLTEFPGHQIQRVTADVDEPRFEDPISTARLSADEVTTI